MPIILIPSVHNTHNMFTVDSDFPHTDYTHLPYQTDAMYHHFLCRDFQRCAGVTPIDWKEHYTAQGTTSGVSI